MKLSTRCRYGTRAVIEIARNYHRGPTKRKDIAEAQEIADSYLENILLFLKNVNLVGSIRGPRGGFVLTRHPSEITLLEVVSALEGTLMPVECLANRNLCHRIDRCESRPVWKKVQLAQEEALRNITVQDLVDGNL